MERPFPAYKGDEPYIFVSYAHEDDDTVYPEIQWLNDQGFNIWWDEGISGGTKWMDEIAQIRWARCRTAKMEGSVMF